MKALIKPFVYVLFLVAMLSAKAQTTAEDVKTLIRQGITLNDAGKYTEAIDKYDQAIKLDPNASNAYYEKSYTLFVSGKGKEAIPFLEKLLILDPKAGGGYDMLGSIYDDDHQPEKAIDLYKKGIEQDPAYQRLHFNLAISYYRQSKFPESEACAIDAIKLDPKHASSTRVYAMATYQQHKRDCSLLAWCSFMLLEPQTQRSAEAYKFIKNILNYGIKKTGDKSLTISVSDSEIGSGSMIMQLAIVNSLEKKENLSTADSLTFQLKSAFRTIDDFSAEKKRSGFFANYLAKYFGSLANTNNMAAFAHIVCLTDNNADSKTWLKEHKKELDDLNKWTQTTERSF